MNGLYQVSNFGRVKRLSYIKELSSSFNPKIKKPVIIQERILKPAIHPKNSYMYVSLCKDNKPTTYRIHRLVAEAFLKNPDNLPMVNHKDEDRLNNRVDNLEWCNAKYNLNYGTRAEKFSVSRSKPIKCVETGIIYYGVREAERQTGIYQSSISRCCNDNYGFKTAGGYHWEYANE